MILLLSAADGGLGHRGVSFTAWRDTDSSLVRGPLGVKAHIEAGSVAHGQRSPAWICNALARKSH